MKYKVEIVPDGIICAPSFIKIGSGIQVMVRLIHQQSERLQFWYY
jgi:hypothetical protein